MAWYRFLVQIVLPIAIRAVEYWTGLVLGLWLLYGITNNLARGEATLDD